MNHLLGKGSYASVFRGRLLSDDTPAAVKVIDKRIFANQYNLKNIHCEIEIMKKMEHDNIVRLLDVYQTSNNMYILTECCEDGDLRTYLKRKKRLPENEALAFLRDVLRGFEYMTRRDIMHRDLKPANILIKDGKLKISDFGFARNLDQGESTILKSIVGTPLYMSPQILNHQRYTNKSDLWSVGLIYYEMLHGCTPWPANSELQLINAINTKPLTFDPALSDKSKDFIKRCLRRREEDRMTWEEAFSHPLVGEGSLSFRREEKENRTPRQVLMDLRETQKREKLRSKSKSVSANHRLSNLSRTPKRPALRNIDLTP
jgi:serine/threonine-protein kinase ULK/ATG1